MRHLCTHEHTSIDDSPSARAHLRPDCSMEYTCPHCARDSAHATYLYERGFYDREVFYRCTCHKTYKIFA
jgi:hypothetical protein